MISESLKTEIVRHKTDDYDLKVIYYPPRKEASSSDDEKIDICLKINLGQLQKAYRSVFTEQNIPNDVLMVFTGLEIAFQCFREKNGFQIDLTNGKILLKGIFQIKGRRIQKKALITLAKYEVSEHEIMIQQIQELQGQILKLKESKEEREKKLRAEYEERFQEEKKKFEEAVRLTQQKEKKWGEKQREVEASIKELKGLLNELTAKIQGFSTSNQKEIQELKKNAQMYQKQIKKAKQQLEDLNDMKPRQAGRKRVKPNENNHESNEQEHKQNQIENQIPEANGFSIPKHINEKYAFINKFKFEQNSITYIGDQKMQTQLLWKTPLPRSLCRFEIKIIKMSKAIMIGIAKVMESPVKTRYSDKNNFAYSGNTGYVWGLNNFQGEGFKTGDNVILSVDLSKPYLEWKVNGEVEASCRPSGLLMDSSFEIVPFITMETPGDCIIWNQL